MPDISGHNIGRYHIIEPLGEGGMANVYRAYDTHLECDVAFKVIRREAFPPEILERILKRFEREARVLARLNHPNIVPVMDYGEHDGSPYLVMRYMPGGTLKQRMAGYPMPVAEAARLLLPIAQALDYAHQSGILHRDVKPSNVLITETGMPVLTDFGIARMLESGEGHTLTGTGVGIGTPEYMAPEQGLGRGVDARADIYALGVVFYELLTGRRPYEADTPMAVVLMHMTDPLPRPRQFIPDLPEEVEKILFKVLSKKPEDRYPDMKTFAGVLERLAAVYTYGSEKGLGIESGRKVVEERTQDTGGPGVLDEAQPEAQPAWRKSQAGGSAQQRAGRKTSRARLLGLGGMLLLAVVAGLLFTLRQPEPPRRIGTQTVVAVAAQTAAVVSTATIQNTAATRPVEPGNTPAQAPPASPTDAPTLKPTVTQPAGPTQDPAVINSANAGMLVDVLRAHVNHSVDGMAVSPDGTIIAIEFANIELYDAQTLSFLHEIKTGTKVNELAFSPDGLYIAGNIGPDASVRIWKMADGKLYKSFFLPQPATCLDYSPDGTRLATCDGTNFVRLLNIAGGKQERTLAGHSKPVRSVAFSPDGRYLASGGEDGLLILWNVVEGTEVWRSTGEQGVISDVTYSPDGRLVASVDADKEIVQVYLANDGTNIAQIEQEKGNRVWRAAFSKGGDVVFAFCQEFLLRVWQLDPVMNLVNKSAWWSVAGGFLELTQDGRTLVVATGDGDVTLFRIPDR